MGVVRVRTTMDAETVLSLTSVRKLTLSERYKVPPLRAAIRRNLTDGMLAGLRCPRRLGECSFVPHCAQSKGRARSLRSLRRGGGTYHHIGSPLLKNIGNPFAKTKNGKVYICRASRPPLGAGAGSPSQQKEVDMFTICEGKGFTMKFSNGNTVSVQWGPLNYCERKSLNITKINQPMNTGFWNSEDAEVAAWDKDGNKHNFGYETISGWMSADEVLEFISFVGNNKLNTKEDTDESACI